MGAAWMKAFGFHGWVFFFAILVLDAPKCHAEDSRAVLNEWLEADPRPDSTEEIMRLVRSYRHGSGSGSGRTQLPLREAPYVSMLLAEKTPELFAQAYDSNYADQYEKNVKNVPLETLHDAFMQLIIDGGAPASIEEQAKSIGKCLARKSLRGKGPSCQLDPSENTKSPNYLGLFWAKFTCGWGFLEPSPCRTRKWIYDAAKPALISARKDPSVIALVSAEFDKRFPAEFRKAFLEQISDKILRIGILVAAKFSGAVDSLWEAQAPLIEDEPTALSLHGFAEGLHADIAAASALANTGDPNARGLAGALFYAAANKLLVLTGGTETKMAWPHPAIAPGNVFDPSQPKRAPVFLQERFGGWSVHRGTDGTLFSPWNWGEERTDTRLFPTFFSISGRGIASLPTGAAAEQELDDLAMLLDAVTLFLENTAEGTTLSRHFGEMSQMDQLLEASSPILFPREGRMLAIGVLGGILENLIDPRSGHILIQQPGQAPLVFRQRVSLDGAIRVPIQTGSIVRIIGAIARIRALMKHDRQIPDSLRTLDGQLDSGIQLAALVLGGEAQNRDGSFKSEFGDVADEPSMRATMATVRGAQGLSTAYEMSGMFALKIRLRTAWQYLDRRWGVEPLSRADGWRWISLWERSARFRAETANEFPWETWRVRMEELRQTLQRE